MRIGSYNVHSLLLGGLQLDGGAMFGNVPRALWAREAPPDEKNRIRMATRSLLLRGDDGRTVLVDAGCGTGFSEKERSIYGIEYDLRHVEQALREHGVTREGVTDVILTHLHFDHAGGTVIREGDRLTPVFPNAKVHAQRSNIEAARSPNPREVASYQSDIVEALEAAGVLHPLNGDSELLPGIHVRVADGHTWGMQIVLIEGDGGPLAFPADLIPMSSHLRIPYTMGYDLHIEWIMRDKKALLDDMAARNGIVVFEHDPEVVACRVRTGGKYHEIAERVDL